jgi:hypothetical protein
MTAGDGAAAATANPAAATSRANRILDLANIGMATPK